MRVLVCGASGCVGAAVSNALRSRGHCVVAGVRCGEEGDRLMRIDYMHAVPPARWAECLCERRIDAVVNCVGILMETRRERFERVHAQGPIELFRGAALAGVQRVVQVSALGVGAAAQSVDTPYLHTKLQADDALASSRVEWAVLRPALVCGPGSQSGRLFATLASLPVIGLPGRGRQAVAPVHVFELAEGIVRLLEAPRAPNAVFEVGGPVALTYRAMLQAYRSAQGLGPALWLPLPMPLMKLGAWIAEALPQKVFSRDTLRLLELARCAAPNALPALLGREPSALAQCLAISPPEPLLDTRVVIGAPVARALRWALGVMWLCTALVSAALPHASGVLALLARCGFEGRAGAAAWVFSCVLNAALGALTIARPAPGLYAVQLAAVIGYSATAALNMPALLIDHCGPLVKNLPIAMLVLLLWMALPPPLRGAARSRATSASADSFPCNSGRATRTRVEQFGPAEGGANPSHP